MTTPIAPRAVIIQRWIGDQTREVDRPVLHPRRLAALGEDGDDLLVGEPSDLRGGVLDVVLAGPWQLVQAAAGSATPLRTSAPST
jgi:hypothetical protein